MKMSGIEVGVVEMFKYLESVLKKTGSFEEGILYRIKNSSQDRNHIRIIILGSIQKDKTEDKC